MPSVEHEQIVAMMAGGLGLEDLSVDEQRLAMEASAGMFPVDADVLACAVGMSPWTDLEGTGPSAEPGAVDQIGAFLKRNC